MNKWDVHVNIVVETQRNADNARNSIILTSETYTSITMGGGSGLWHVGFTVAHEFGHVLGLGDQKERAKFRGEEEKPYKGMENNIMANPRAVPWESDLQYIMLIHGERP